MTSPPVLLVHGVGLGPDTFDRTRMALAAAGHRVVVVTRPGYDVPATVIPPARVVPLEEQLDGIAELIAGLGAGPAVWVGVSGGATLGLLARERIPDSLAATLLHEPLAGSVAPELRDSVLDRIDRMRSTWGPGAAVQFVHDLVGEATWGELPLGTVTTLVRREDLVRGEAPMFATYEPAQPRAGRSVPVVVSVGARSSPLRHRSVTAIAAWLGCPARVLAGVGHLPQVDDPLRFADVIDEQIGVALEAGAPNPGARP